MNNKPTGYDLPRFLRLHGVNRSPAFTAMTALVWFSGLLLLLPAKSLNAQSIRSGEACSIGVECKAKIAIGEGYATGTETVEAAITILEVVRGEKAWALVKAADSSNKPAETGMEYVAVRIRFDYGQKGGSEDLSYGIRSEQFASISEGGKQYESPSVAAPIPELKGRLYPGESLEGWIVLLVSIDDRKPRMTFGNNYNRLYLKLF
jgi:hypothetical protein